MYNWYEFRQLALQNAKLEDKMRYQKVESNQCILESDATTKQFLQELSLQKSKIAAIKAELDRRDMESTTNGRDMEFTMGRSYATYVAFYLLVANTSISACAYFHGQIRASLGKIDITWIEVFYSPLMYAFIPRIAFGKWIKGPDEELCFAILVLLGDFIVSYFYGPLVLVLVLCFCNACALCVKRGKSLVSSANFICIAAVFSPPLAVLLKKGFSEDFMINCLFTLGYFPGVIHAFSIVLKK